MRGRGSLPDVLDALLGTTGTDERSDRFRMCLDEACRSGQGIEVIGQAGLDNVVPAYAHWRLADMPRYLAAEQVSRLIAA